MGWCSFNSRVNIHFEDHGVLGTDLWTWKLPIARAEVQAIINQDLDQLRASVRAAQMV